MTGTIPQDSGIWVLADYSEGEIADVSLELASEARQLADRIKEEVCVVLVGCDLEALAEKLGPYGVDRLFLVDSPLLDDAVELRVQALANMITEIRPHLLLCSADPFGRDVAVRLAAALETGLAPNCVSLELIDDGLIQMTSPVYGNKATAKLVFPESRPAIATVAPGTFQIKRARAARQTQVVTISPELDASVPCTRVLRLEKGDPRTMSLEEAPIIVSGGRGVGCPEHFALLEKLAEALNGVTAGSRMAVDEGYVPVSRQVGQTGKTVTPKLYIACGISGSSYHTIGMKDSKAIIAINKDRNAPMFKLADIGIVGDLVQVVPAITSELAGMQASAKKT